MRQHVSGVAVANIGLPRLDSSCLVLASWVTVCSLMNVSITVGYPKLEFSIYQVKWN